MDPVFENRYYTTKETLSEFFWRFRTRIISVCYIIYTLAMFGYILYHYCYVMGYGPLELPYGLVLLLLLLCVGVCLRHRLVAARSIRMAKKEHDGVQPQTVVRFFEDEVQMQEGSTSYAVPYRKILRTVRLKYSYVLQTTPRGGIVIDPDEFIKGTFEDFKQFLKEKCPGLTVVE